MTMRSAGRCGSTRIRASAAASSSNSRWTPAAGTTSQLWWPTWWRTRPLASGRSAHAQLRSTPNSDLDHDFDVARLLGERLLETFQRYPPGDEPAEPVGVGGGQRGD